MTAGRNRGITHQEKVGVGDLLDQEIFRDAIGQNDQIDATLTQGRVDAGAFQFSVGTDHLHAPPRGHCQPARIASSTMVSARSRSSREMISGGDKVSTLPALILKLRPCSRQR